MLSRLKRKGQSGQSLVILAIGFLALLGFVGIVTDVSVLFIRYSTMRRAVDAAAIAAAGQMRRIQDTMLGSGIADGQATSVANLNLAARQFIEVYGLNPKSVIVETCRAQQIGRNVAGDPVDAAGNVLYVDDPSSTDPLVKMRNPAADQATIDRYEELCTEDELKLVRVTTQIDAPTIFLRLLGYPTVTLTETAISQTAVIDVVLIFDVSESMRDETDYDSWDNIPNSATPKQGVRYMPPYIDQNHLFQDIPNPDYDPLDPFETDPPTIEVYAWDQINASTQAQLNARIDPNLTTVDQVFGDKTIAFEPDGAGGWQLFNVVSGGLSNQNRAEPREFCRVRAFPGTTLNLSPTDLAVREDYFAFFQGPYSSNGTDPAKNYAAQFHDMVVPAPPPGGYSTPSDAVTGTYYQGFVPMYNFHGCCNDPDGNFVFDDLICQPFKAARDAAHQFLNRLDFLRGDRVAFVTFDHSATLIDPDGNGSQATMIETQSDIPDPSNPPDLLRKGADNVLDDVIGVRGDTYSYVDSDQDGLWDHLWDDGLPVTYDELLNSKLIGDIRNHPVFNACPFTVAALPGNYLSTTTRIRPDGSERDYNSPLIADVMTVPTWYMTSGNGLPAPEGPGYYAQYRNYEYRASCAGANVGAALATGSGTLYNEGRREGAVWIMVLLSDGAAGASNPITRYDNQNLLAADPFATAPKLDGTGDAIAPAIGLNGPFIDNPNGGGGYGIFGLCPYGTQTQPSQLLMNDSTDYFPLCSDLRPETRHFCGTVAIIPDVTVDNDPSGNCFNYYNVDDYARDWADWVGLTVLPGVETTGTTGRVNNQLLPTIFTIGYGIAFNGENDAIYPCSANDYDCYRGINQNLTGLTRYVKRILRDRNADYLGEELLRYIADVGDNNQIDNDYWQVCMSGARAMVAGNTNCRDDGTLAQPSDPERIENYIDITSSSPNWGPRGSCQLSAFTPGAFGRGTALDPLPPNQPCGNYFVAATGEELEEVFNQIASRMFTRLSQ